MKLKENKQIYLFYSLFTFLNCILFNHGDIPSSVMSLLNQNGRASFNAMLLFILWVLPIIFVVNIGIIKYLRFYQDKSPYFIIRDEGCKAILKLAFKDILILTLTCLLIKLLMLIIVNGVWIEDIQGLMIIISEGSLEITLIFLFIILWMPNKRDKLLFIYIISLISIYFIILFTPIIVIPMDLILLKTYQSSIFVVVGFIEYMVVSKMIYRFYSR